MAVIKKQTFVRNFQNFSVLPVWSGAWARGAYPHEIRSSAGEKVALRLAPEADGDYRAAALGVLIY